MLGAPPFFVVNYFAMTQFATEFKSMVPSVASLLDANPVRWILLVAAWAWFCEKLKAPDLRKETEGLGLPQASLTTQMRQMVVVHVVLLIALAKPVKDQASGDKDYRHSKQHPVFSGHCALLSLMISFAKHTTNRVWNPYYRSLIVESTAIDNDSIMISRKLDNTSSRTSDFAQP